MNLIKPNPQLFFKYSKKKKKKKELRRWLKIKV